jgi:radical SAM superfamily enzyme YgiQ (UPF0313 family)
VLGGVYATLCPEHASAHSGADELVQGQVTESLIALLDRLTGYRRETSYSPLDFNRLRPAYDLYEHLEYAGLLTSIGCPFRCTYCASQLLQPSFIQRSPESVFREIEDLSIRRNIHNFAFTTMPCW